SKYIEIRGIKIHYLTGGSGKPLLHIPGWAITAEMNRKVGEFLSENYKVYIIDTPGDGKSGQIIKNWKYEDYIQVMEEFINKLNLNNIILIGHSFGGAIAISLVDNNPNIFEKVYLANTIGIAPDKVLIEYIQGKLRVDRKLYKLIPSYFKNFFFPTFTDQLIALKIIKDLEISDVIERVDKEFILLWGEEDHILSDRYKERLIKKFKNIKLVEIEGASHNMPMLEPERFAKYINNYD
ncbi:alpha/beta hydrolase, partial [bacterium]|nr:alpha/beta hydrolase [bacterium]